MVAPAGAVVVVGPQDVAHLDARKFVDFLRSADVPILGGIENMAGLVCPHCGERIDVFGVVAAARSIWLDGVSLLGRIPLDPQLAIDRQSSEQLKPFDRIADRLLEVLGESAAA